METIEGQVTPEWYLRYLRSYADSLPLSYNSVTINGATDALEQTIYEFENKLSQSVNSPCKCGDTVYRLILTKNGSGFIEDVPVCGFHYIDPPNQRSNKRGSYLIVYHESSGTISHLPYSQIGKTVFFSYDDAKKALDERRAMSR